MVSEETLYLSASIICVLAVLTLGSVILLNRKKLKIFEQTVLIALTLMFVTSSLVNYEKYTYKKNINKI